MDTRQEALEAWLRSFCDDPLNAVPASSDASFRRYFRYSLKGRSVIAMDAPPPQEDCRPFVDIAQRLHSAGLHVPEIMASDISQGFLLLSDLGSETYLDVMNTANADSLFTDAIDALVTMQANTAVAGLPEYDEALLRRELMLFPDWYLKRHLGLSIDPFLHNKLEALFDFLIAEVLKQGRVFVHRDFMPRNLMVSTPNPGVLDFQDAVLGPISYDPACLFKDAFISWPAPKIQYWLQDYWQKAQQKGLPVPACFADFQRDCDLMGVQRHLKVIGIFARICHRDGKPHYLSDVPRFFNYLREVAERRPELEVLSDLLSLLPTVSGDLS